MGILRNIADRLSGVLGRDCQGAPLNVGDVVVLVGGTVKEQFQGYTATVVGPDRSGRSPSKVEGRGPLVEISLQNGFGGRIRANSLRLVKPDAEPTSWSEVERLSGWTPNEFKEEEHA